MRDIRKLLDVKVQKTKNLLALKKKAKAIKLIERQKRPTGS